LTKTPENQSFVVTIFIFSYMLPMSLIIYFYSQIVSHVVNHEKTLREQVSCWSWYVASHYASWSE